MNRWFATSIAVVCTSVSVAASAAAAAPAPPAADPSKAEGRFKNIQVFKGYPADDVLPAMQFLSAALGVDCEYCHVERAPEKDDKKEKQTARKMIEMTFAINRQHFDGHREVTCMSCHHGASRPVSVPSVSAGEREEEPAEAKAPELPAAAAVLDKYIGALGGSPAIAKIGSRVQKGKLTGFGPNPVPVEISAKAPGKRIAIVHNPGGDNITAFDGRSGWLGNSGRPPRDMSTTESDAVRLDAALLFSSDFRPLFKDFKVTAADTIDGKNTLKVVARNEGKPPAELWFDAQTGLLVRLMRFAETPVGRNPTQIDFADYREADGVKVPFRWTVARPSGRFTIQVDSSEQNVAVDDKVFQKPSPPPS